MSVKAGELDRVLSATCWVWVVGFDAMPQGLEGSVPLRIADAVVNGHAHLQVRSTKDGKPTRYPLVVVAGGSRMGVDPAMVTVVDCGAPVVRLTGLVTTARVPKVEGHLVRRRGDEDARRWLFVAGLDPYNFAITSGLAHDPVVEEAGLISVPSDNLRERRKAILGFGEGA